MLIRSLLILAIALPIGAAEEIQRDRSDVPYKSGAGLTTYETERCKLDVYLPEGGSNHPVVVWFHGGALKKGDKRATPDDGVKTEQIAASLAKAGIAMVVPNYRFSPQVGFPAYLEDGAAAVRWAHEHLEELGGDRLYIGGHSAGGYITLMLGLDARYLEAEGVKLDDLAGLIPVSSQTMTHYTVREERGLGRYQVTADEAAPVHYVRKDTPPMLLFYADDDLVARVDENEFFIELLKGAKNPGIKAHLISDRDHGTIASEIANPGDPARVAILEWMGLDPAK